MRALRVVRTSPCAPSVGQPALHLPFDQLSAASWANLGLCRRSTVGAFGLWAFCFHSCFSRANGRFHRRGAFTASACKPLFGSLSSRCLSFAFWITSNNSVARLLGRNSGLMQTETMSGRGHSGGIVGPRENLRRKNFQVADVNHILGESIGC